MVDDATKFEIYVEQLFRKLGKKVERDVLVINEKRRTRTQLDIVIHGMLRKGFYELKYTSSDVVGITYGRNPVDQVVNAAEISGYMPKGIITNGTGFSGQVVDAAEENGIKLFDVSYLIALEDERLSIDGMGWLTLNIGTFKTKVRRVQKKIKGIDPLRYDLTQKRVYA